MEENLFTCSTSESVVSLSPSSIDNFSEYIILELVIIWLSLLEVSFYCLLASNYWESRCPYESLHVTYHPFSGNGKTVVPIFRTFFLSQKFLCGAWPGLLFLSELGLQWAILIWKLKCILKNFNMLFDNSCLLPICCFSGNSNHFRLDLLDQRSDFLTCFYFKSFVFPQI